MLSDRHCPQQANIQTLPVLCISREFERFNALFVKSSHSLKIAQPDGKRQNVHYKEIQQKAFYHLNYYYFAYSKQQWWWETSHWLKAIPLAISDVSPPKSQVNTFSYF